MLSVATLNLLDDLLYWEERAPLVLEELRSLRPDAIALQEVCLDPNTAEWLADRLPGYSAYVSPGTGVPSSDSLAVITRCPVEAADVLHLGAQGRQAQRMVLRENGRRWTFVNTHLVWNPFEDVVRTEQAAKILSWIEADQRAILCGDLNALPSSGSVALLKGRLRSAHETVHGTEPEYTYPTPLDRGPGLRHWARHAVLRANGLVRRRQNTRWGGTIDYIFVDPGLTVSRCEVAFGSPSPRNPKLYPSDHLGLFAALEDGT